MITKLSLDGIFWGVGFGVVFEKEREVAKYSILGLNTGVGRVKSEDL